jgi:hypothetical protein
MTPGFSHWETSRALVAHSGEVSLPQQARTKEYPPPDRSFRRSEAPEGTKAADSKAMAMTEEERAATERTGWGREHTQPERERLLPHPTR